MNHKHITVIEDVEAGETRILRLSNVCHCAQIMGVTGWVTLRKCLSRESAEAYLRQWAAALPRERAGT